MTESLCLYFSSQCSTHIAVVGNNIHLPRREVDASLARGYARNHHMPYIEASWRTGEGVHEAFYTIVREIRLWVSQTVDGSII